MSEELSGGGWAFLGSIGNPEFQCLGVEEGESWICGLLDFFMVFFSSLGGMEKMEKMVFFSLQISKSPF